MPADHDGEKNNNYGFASNLGHSKCTFWYMHHIKSLPKLYISYLSGQCNNILVEAFQSVVHIWYIHTCFCRAFF